MKLVTCQEPTVLLSFDIEEFDTPTEHNVQIPFNQQISISCQGTLRILDLLRQVSVRATFFCTANFAEHAPHIIKAILAGGHEVASHGYRHDRFEVSDLELSRRMLEDMTSQPVTGYRMARMMPVSESEIRKAGYTYNSSLNPTWIPGRYNNCGKPRTYFMLDGVIQIPASVTPVVRFPLFWLSCHNLPGSIYRMLARWTLRHDRYLCIYFHPWEFTDLKAHPEFRLPSIITRRSGDGMVGALSRFIESFASRGIRFSTMQEFVSEIAPDVKK